MAANKLILVKFNPQVAPGDLTLREIIRLFGENGLPTPGVLERFDDPVTGHLLQCKLSLPAANGAKAVIVLNNYVAGLANEPAAAPLVLEAFGLDATAGLDYAVPLSADQLIDAFGQPAPGVDAVVAFGSLALSGSSNDYTDGGEGDSAMPLIVRFTNADSAVWVSSDEVTTVKRSDGEEIPLVFADDLSVPAESALWVYVDADGTCYLYKNEDTEVSYLTFEEAVAAGAL